MANKLEKLIINRADLVDSPSNPLARVVLFKNIYGPKTTEGEIATRTFMDSYHLVMSAFYNSMDGLMYDSQLDDKKRVSMMKDSIEQAAGMLTGLMDTYPFSKSDEAENDEIYAKIEKTVDVFHRIDTLIANGDISIIGKVTDILEGLKMAEKKTETNDTNETVDALKAEVAAKVTALETAGVELAKMRNEIDALKKAATASKEPEVEDIWKGVNPAIRAQFEELKKQADESAKIAKEAEETAAMVKLTKRVTEELNGIAGTIDEKTALLRSVEKAAGSKLFEKLYITLKTASETIKKSEILTEKGHVGNANLANGNTAFEKIRAQAKLLVEKGQAKSEAAAIAAVSRQNPDLYKEYIEEGAN